MQSLVKEFLVDEVASGLQEKPALLQFRDERGRNWLHLCANVDVSTKVTLDPQESVRLAALLLERGIEINVPAFTEGTWHATPLWYATARGRNLVLAKFLLQSGSTPEHCLWAASYHEDLPMLRTLVAGGAPLEAIAEGETPLLGAVKYSKFKAAKLLLEVGCDPNFQDEKGMTALHYMLKKNSDKSQFGMFVEHGVRGDIPNADDMTAAAIMRRKRDPYFHRIAERIAP
jgi:ankyrin repeat protein